MSSDGGKSTQTHRLRKRKMVCGLKIIPSGMLWCSWLQCLGHKRKGVHWDSTPTYDPFPTPTHSLSVPLHCSIVTIKADSLKKTLPSSFVSHFIKNLQRKYCQQCNKTTHNSSGQSKTLGNAPHQEPWDGSEAVHD